MITPPRPLASPGTRSDWLNRLRRNADQSRPTPGSGTLMVSTTRGVSYSVRRQSGGGGGAAIKTFQIKAIREGMTASIGDNDLACVEWDGTTPGTTEFIVARPWLSRRYVYEGTGSYVYVDAQKRTITSGTTKDTHEITAPYAVGNMIVAVRLHTERDPVGNETYEWEWLDLNMDGRDWARTKTETV